MEARDRHLQDAPQIIAEQAVAKRWNRSVRTLQRWRKSGSGPAWMQIGGGVFYRLEDVLAFEAAARRGGGAP